MNVNLGALLAVLAFAGLMLAIFGALYLSFLGQPSGPRAGWLLASLPAAFVVERLRAASSADTLTP